ncbi:MAG: hypothetical protein H3C36_14840 [Chitinophagaceae bacterium]|nr:hypothetical protein [Chitinophagaceae bacterium]
MDQKENTFYFTILISSLVLLSLIAVFSLTALWLYRKRIATQKELENRNLFKLESDRQRLADSLQNILLPVFNLMLPELEALKLPDDESRSSVAEIKLLASRAVEQLTRLSSLLVPRQLEEVGPAAALKNFAGIIQDTYHLPVHFSGSDIPRLTKEAELHIYRLAEELLDNIIVHAKATQAFLNISSSERNITLLVSDDGIGLDLPYVKKSKKALGLRNILARAFVLDAEVFIESNNEGGTTYIIDIPIQNS